MGLKYLWDKKTNIKMQSKNEEAIHMNFTEKVVDICRKKNSLVCVGLDTDIRKIPQFLLEKVDPIFEFNKAIIDATQDFVAAFKPNLAFYESLGLAGWQALEKTMKYIPSGILTIADAKRGDIGNTSRHYARAFFEYFNFDCITVNPYLGFDSISSFMDWEEKGVFILCLTSNKGSKDFQYFKSGGQTLYEKVAEMAESWNGKQNCGLVVGATHPSELAGVREIVPDMPLLIPGIGAQGGDLEQSLRYGTDDSGERALFNSSRGIIYKSSGEDFGEAAGEEARSLQELINSIRGEIL